MERITFLLPSQKGKQKMEVLYDKENVILLGCEDYRGYYCSDTERKIGEVLTAYLTDNVIQEFDITDERDEWDQYHMVLEKFAKGIILMARKYPKSYQRRGPLIKDIYNIATNQHPLLMFYMEQLIYIVCQFALERKIPTEDWLKSVLLHPDEVNLDKFEVYRYHISEMKEDQKIKLCQQYCEEAMTVFCCDILSVKDWVASEIGLLNEIRKQHPKLNEEQTRVLLTSASDKRGKKVDYNIEPQHFIYARKTAAEENEDDDLVQRKIYRRYRINTLYDILKLEIIHIIKQNLPIYLCKYCHGAYMNYEKGSKTYCGRVHINKVACRKVGPRRTYTREHHSDPIHRCFIGAYNRKYKHFSDGRLERERFDEWLSFAQEMRDAARAGEISVEEFKEMMKDLEAEYKPTKKVRKGAKV